MIKCDCNTESTHSVQANKTCKPNNNNIKASSTIKRHKDEQAQQNIQCSGGLKSDIACNHSMETAFNFTKKGLHIANLNIQHLLPKIDEIKYVLLSKECNIDIFGLCETFLNESMSDINLNISNLTYIRKDRKDKKGGGILVYIANHVPFKHRPDLECDEIESVCIEIYYRNTKSFILNFVYRPPNSKLNWLDSFDAQIKQIEALELEYHTLGDFNFKYLPDKMSFECKKWSKFVLKYGLTQLINNPTRVTETSSSIIDHVYTNRVDRICDVFVPFLSISDHYPICVTRKIHNKRPKNNTHSIITYRCFKKFVLAEFQNDLSLSQLHLIETEHDPNSSLSLLYNILHTALSKHAPFKQKRVKSTHQPTWLNNEVKQALRERDRLRKNNDWENYKIMRNKTLALIRKSKKEYYNEAVKNGTSTKHIWKNLKMIANYDNDDEEIVLPSKLLVNNLVVRW